MKVMMRLLCLIFVYCLLRVVAAADEQDIKQQIEITEKYAREGDGNAAFMVGYVKQKAGKLTEAFEWYELGAKAGNKGCQLALGLMYIKGDPIKRDPYLAAELFYKSAIQGVSDAQFNLARILMGFAEADQKDLAKAAVWLSILHEGSPNDKEISWYVEKVSERLTKSNAEKAALYEKELRTLLKTSERKS